MTSLNISARELKANLGTCLKAAAGGETVRVVSRGHVQTMLVPADTRAATDAAPPKGSPAALLVRDGRAATGVSTDRKKNRRQQLLFASFDARLNLAAKAAGLAIL